MRALVTGGAGFIGKAIATALRERGDAVRTLGRRDAPELGPLGIDHHRGDVIDALAVHEAVRGCDVVFHVAAKVSAAGSPAEFWAVNVQGTQNVLDACRSEGVGRLVFTSSPAVVAGTGDLEGADERLPYPDHHEALYPATKAQAEQRVRAAHGPALATVALRPHIVYGPGDTSLLPRLLARAPRLRRLADDTKKMDVTFIDDAVAAHLRAADALADRPDVVGGKAYFITSGEAVPIWGFIDRVLAAAGRPPVRRTASPRLALAAATVAEALHRWTGRPGEPPITRWIVRELSTSHWFDISAARTDLGYAPQVDLDEGLRRLTAWLQDQPPRGTSTALL